MAGTKNANRRRSYKFNRRLAISHPDGGFLLRVSRRKASAKKSERLLVKCGCCESSFEIHSCQHMLEISGVSAPVAEWRRLMKLVLRGDSI